MPELPNAHPGAPLTVWLRPSVMWSDRWYQSALDPPEPDAVEYVRKDVCDAWLERAVNEPLRPGVRQAITAALEALEEDAPYDAMMILRTCLQSL